MIALLPSLIVALIIMIHERRNYHPIQMWVKEDWIMFTLAVVFWPFAVVALLWVVVWPKVSCWFGVHRFIIVQVFSEESRRVHCLHCKQSFAMNDRTRMPIPWDRSWHELYEHYGHKIKYLSSEVRWK